jgi:hypothetical protein
LNERGKTAEMSHRILEKLDAAADLSLKPNKFIFAIKGSFGFGDDASCASVSCRTTG